MKNIKSDSTKPPGIQKGGICGEVTAFLAMRPFFVIQTEEIISQPIRQTIFSLYYNTIMNVGHLTLLVSARHDYAKVDSQTKA